MLNLIQLQSLTEPMGTIGDKLAGWWNTVVLNLPNIAAAVVILVLAFLLTGLVKNLVAKLSGRVAQRPSVARLINNGVTGVFVFLTLILILKVLNLHGTVTSLLTGAGIAGLVLGLALQEPIGNTFAGIMLAVQRTHNVGDHVEFEGYEGVIQEIGLRRTSIRLFHGPVVIVPNKAILSNASTNYSLGERYRMDIECGVSYGDDLRKVRKITMEALAESPEVENDSEIEFFFTEFGASSINFVVRFWHDQTDKLSMFAQRNAAIIAIKEAFDENGIDIPFPIRTLDFGIKGGEKLGEALDAIPFRKVEKSAESA